MTRAYSMDLRQRVVADCDKGMGSTEVARKYSVSPAWVRRLKQHRRERGDLKPRPRGHRRRQFDREQLAKLVEQQPDATLRELRDELGVQVALSAIWNGLQELQLTFKKSRFTLPSRIDQMSQSVEPDGE